jgi:hypothetical protein
VQGGEGAGLVSGLGVVAFARTERGVVLVEGVGNVFEENEFDEGMLVLTCAPMFTPFGLLVAFGLAMLLGFAASMMLRRLPSAGSAESQLSAVRQSLTTKPKVAVESLAVALGVTGIGVNGCLVRYCHGELHTTIGREQNQGVGGVGLRPRWLMAVLAR